MKELRKYNVASLILNLFIIFFTFEGFIDSFRANIIRDPDWFGFEGIHSLRFFTVLSNLFVAIVAVLIVIYNVKNIVKDEFNFPNWLIILKHVSTCAVAVTFTTVALLLAPSYAIVGKGYFTLFLGNHIYMHLLSPVLAIISYVVLERSHKIKFKKSLWALLPVALYEILYVIMVVFIGQANGGWPDFYNFTFGGHVYAIPLSAIGMLLLTFLLSMFLAKIHNKFVNI